MTRKHKHWVKAAGLALVVVVGWDLYKAHTGGPRPHGTNPGSR